ncbi:DUF488 domain-containing protein [Acidipropionibacterium virtanenii]|uniref:Uncharacterized protein n=1 Tax=Acidipropionibacterium virtanenii TaxID=2057246 RepID=A0A344UY51_9ACTN|nr:DUF488 family protein [Acidipropionibacterium virtanenii]AXE40199.1 hypothetical protein JS278_03065 [Acidipropionibacterium virtanenii]
MTTFQIANIRDEIRDGAQDDGYRVLVDRLWPRGVSKEKAALDEHRKEIAPSNELRKWFGHDPDRFEEFAARYREELDASGAAETFAHDMAGHDLVTLLYGAKDREHNQAVVLKQVLDELGGA